LTKETGNDLSHLLHDALPDLFFSPTKTNSHVQGLPVKRFCVFPYLFCRFPFDTLLVPTCDHLGSYSLTNCFFALDPASAVQLVNSRPLTYCHSCYFKFSIGSSTFFGYPSLTLLRLTLPLGSYQTNIPYWLLARPLRGLGHPPPSNPPSGSPANPFYWCALTSSVPLPPPSHPSNFHPIYSPPALIFQSSIPQLMTLDVCCRPLPPLCKTYAHLAN